MTERRRARRLALLLPAVGVAVALCASATPATADEQPKGRSPHDVQEMLVPYDPLLEDFLLTDAAEAQDATIGAGVSCQYEGAITGPNAAPTDPSFQMVYIVPTGVTPDRWVDEPRSCSDGSVRYSSIARSSRNGASFQAAQNAGLHFRTLTYSYTHNYTLNKYATRVVRRFRSAYTEESWNNLTPAGRISRVRNELTQASFNQSRTKYLTLVDAGTFEQCSDDGCGHAPGVAELDGPYGNFIRYYVESYTYATKYYRYGCAGFGDTIFNHEATHTVGARHVYDHSRDLMSEDGGFGYTMRSSPSILWDYGRDNYHDSVRSNAFVGVSQLAGNYYTC